MRAICRRPTRLAEAPIKGGIAAEGPSQPSRAANRGIGGAAKPLPARMFPSSKGRRAASRGMLGRTARRAGVQEKQQAGEEQILAQQNRPRPGPRWPTHPVRSRDPDQHENTAMKVDSASDQSRSAQALPPAAAPKRATIVKAAERPQQRTTSGERGTGSKVAADETGPSIAASSNQRSNQGGRWCNCGEVAVVGEKRARQMSRYQPRESRQDCCQEPSRPPSRNLPPGNGRSQPSIRWRR